MTYISDQYPEMILQKEYKPPFKLEVGTSGGLLEQITQGTQSTYEEMTEEKMIEIVMDLYNTTGNLMIDRSAKLSTTEAQEKKL